MKQLYHTHSLVKPNESPALPFSEASLISGSQTRITCEPRVVCNLDTLKISFWVNFEYSQLLDHIDEAKMKAQSGDSDSEPIDIECFEWNCHRQGARLFPYRLTRGDVTLLLNGRSHDSNFPTMRLEIGSLSCWAPGYQYIYDHIIRILELFGGIVVKEIVSEVHLCADFIGTNIRSLNLDEKYWVTRAHSYSSNSTRHTFSGITWGKDNFMLRVYDKVLELQKDRQKQQAFRDAWQLEDYNSQPVTRVEFQIRRKTLNGFQPTIKTLNDLHNHLSSLWNHCCCSWCRLSQEPVNRNHNQSKSKTHPWWQMVQSVKWNGDNQLIRSKLYLQKDTHKLCQQFLGLAMTIAAVNGKQPEDLEGIIAFSQGTLEGDMKMMFRKDRKEFMKRMQRKINESVGPFQVPAGGVVL